VKADSAPSAQATHHVEGRAPSADGLSLHWQAWVPDAPRAALLFVHGLHDHSGRYRGPAEHFSARGYACYALDTRGHGRSEGPRVHVERFDAFVDDALAVRDLVRERHPQLPVFLVGHSQGGLVVLRAALRSPEDVAGIVAVSPFLGVHPRSSKARQWAARALAPIAPGLLLTNPIDIRLLSRDPAVGRAYAEDPLVSHTASPGWFVATLQAQRDVDTGAASLRLPVLVLAAGDDRIVDPDAARRWASRAPADRVTYMPWPGLYHELLNEPERLEVYEAIERWLRARSGGAPYS
jgi:alpha-beta hydrolase superfamily lysophospholipase